MGLGAAEGRQEGPYQSNWRRQQTHSDGNSLSDNQHMEIVIGLDF